MASTTSSYYADYYILTPGHFISGAVLFPVIGAALVTLRFANKRRRAVSLGIDDWLIIPALVFLTALCVVTLWGVAMKSFGYLTPTDPLVMRPRRVIEDTAYWIIEWMMTLTLGCIKLSFVFFYRRIFNRSRLFNFITLAFIGILIVWTIGFFLGFMLRCAGHMDGWWTIDTAYRRRYCWSSDRFRTFVSAWCWSDVVTDVILILMPIPNILKLNLNLKKKLGLVLTFMLGSLALIASTVRAAKLERFVIIEKSIPHDILMLVANEAYFAVLETGLAFIAVNLPVVYGVIGRDNVASAFNKVRKFSLLSHSSSASQASFMKKPDDAEFGGRGYTAEPKEHVIDTSHEVH